MAPRVMIFTGVPTSASINWNAVTLVNDFALPFYKIGGLSKPVRSSQGGCDASASHGNSVWRSIPLKRAHLATGFSQVHGFNGHFRVGDNFFSVMPSTSQDSCGSSRTRESVDASHTLLDEFYDHSVALHDDRPSFQLPQPSPNTEQTSFWTDESTSLQDSAADNAGSTSVMEGAPGLRNAHLSDLEDLPNARHLDSIAPQTMTVNLIAGIISIAEPRIINDRWGNEKSLVELLVGDETKAGFSITFWLSNGDSRASGYAMSTERILRSLRRQDIVLLRNVALGSFRSKVHGHSLRKGLTSIELLYRRKLGPNDISGFYTSKHMHSTRTAHPQLSKTRKVREWILMFVAGAMSLGKRKGDENAVQNWEMPPGDTQ